MNRGKGIVAGCPISPIIGALYLLPLDRAIQKNVLSGKIFYLRYFVGRIKKLDIKNIKELIPASG